MINKQFLLKFGSYMKRRITVQKADYRVRYFSEHYLAPRERSLQVRYSQFWHKYYGMLEIERVEGYQ